MDDSSGRINRARHRHIPSDPDHIGIKHAYQTAVRPSFGQWIKQTWQDIITMIIWGGVGLIVYKMPPPVSRYFAITSNSTPHSVVYPDFAYPMRPQLVPIWLATVLAAGVPILAILLAQLRLRSFWDTSNGITGLLYSLITAAAFQALLKWLVGGLRPHFLVVCQPDVSLAAAEGGGDGVGFDGLYYTSEVCTGDATDVADSFESFSSGHATAAFAGFVYLSLYLNARLKVFADYHPSMWKLILLYTPFFGAVAISGTLTIDGFHHWYDVLAGAILGTIMAFSSYRMVFASIWDWRTNHIPLPRGKSFPGVSSLSSTRPAWFHNRAQNRSGRVRGLRDYRDVTSNEVDGDLV